MDLFKNLGFGSETKQKQVEALNSFKRNYTPSGAASTKMPTITPGPMSQFRPAGTSTGVKTPQNTMTSSKPVSAPTPSPYYQAAAAVYNPANNPAAVNVNIGDTIKSDALNSTPSATTLSEKRKASERRVLESKFAKEEEQLLKDIANLRTGISGLQATQNREMLDAEGNPTGQLREGLTSDLSRLSRDQAVELNARTGQLNAYLDNLELYQGYRPQMIGNPIIDETTGEAFSYLQDPMTGEIFTESLGQVTTPKPVDPFANQFSLSEGESQYVFDPVTGEAKQIASKAKTYAPTGGAGGFSGTGGVYTPEQSAALDWDNPNVISSLPVSTLTKAIMSGTGSVKDLTPTQKADVLSEMYSVGYSPHQTIVNKLQNLSSLWKAIPSDQKGLLQGAKFWASKTVPAVSTFESAKELLTRQVARLYDVGVLSDQDVASYKKAMPSRFDSSIDVVNAKLSGISQASTGKTPSQTVAQPGSTIRIQGGKYDGMYAKVGPNGDLIDPSTGQKFE